MQGEKDILILFLSTTTTSKEQVCHSRQAVLVIVPPPTAVQQQRLFLYGCQTMHIQIMAQHHQQWKLEHLISVLEKIRISCQD